ncbi:MAG: V-type ATP synthase subunit C [Sarcina sp.]
MNEMKFTQVLPRLRVLETRLLDKSKIDRLIDSKTSNDTLKILQETDYAAHMSDIKKPEEYEIILSRELIGIYENLYKICPVREVIDVISVKYDYHNLKVLLKGKILKKDFSYMLIPVGVAKLSDLKYAIENDYYRDLNPIMRECIEKVSIDFESNKDPQRIDTIMDKYQFMHIKELEKNLNHSGIAKYIAMQIDLTNIKTLLRVKKQGKNKEFLNDVLISGGKIDKEKFVLLLNDSTENIFSKLSHTDYANIIKEGIAEYSESGSVSSFEKLVDNYIMNYMKDAKFITSGAMPVIAYLYAKENEIKQVRTIMVGKLNSISEEVIRERLRDAYV